MTRAIILETASKRDRRGHATYEVSVCIYYATEMSAASLRRSFRVSAGRDTQMNAGYCASIVASAVFGFTTVPGSVAQHRKELIQADG